MSLIVSPVHGVNHYFALNFGFLSSVPESHSLTIHLACVSRPPMFQETSHFRQQRYPKQTAHTAPNPLDQTGVTETGTPRRNETTNREPEVA